MGGLRLRFPDPAPLLVLLLALLLSSGCDAEEGFQRESPLAGTRIVFSISVAEEEKTAVRQVLERYEARTGARVTLVSVTAANLPAKLAVDVAAGRPSIHLFAQDNLALRTLVDRELVQPLDDVDVPDAIPAEMVPAAFDRTRYFLPFRPNVRVAYANRARFRQAGVTPPRSVDALRDVARRLKNAAGGTPKVVLSLAAGDAAAVTISEWIVSFGGEPLVLNDEGSVRAFAFLQEMWREGLLARESLLAKYDTVVDYLQGETAWLAQNWPFTSGVLAEQGLMDRFAVYEGWRGPARAAHVVGGDVLGIPAGVQGAQRDAAVALARFLVSREAQEHLASRNAWPAVRSDAYGPIPTARVPTFTAVTSALAEGWYRPNVAYWAAVTDAMDEAVRRILQNGEPVQPVLDVLHGEVAAAAGRLGAAYIPQG